jgi:hypothetical protein
VTVFVFAQLAPDFDGQTLKGTFAGWLIGRADWPRNDNRPLVHFVIEFAFGPPATLLQSDGKLNGVRLGPKLPTWKSVFAATILTYQRKEVHASPPWRRWVEGVCKIQHKIGKLAINSPQAFH